MLIIRTCEFAFSPMWNRKRGERICVASVISSLLPPPSFTASSSHLDEHSSLQMHLLAPVSPTLICVHFAMRVMTPKHTCGPARSEFKSLVVPPRLQGKPLILWDPCRAPNVPVSVCPPLWSHLHYSHFCRLGEKARRKLTQIRQLHKRRYAFIS